MIEEVCPTHGECYAGMLECFKGYRKHPNLCVEDSEISESARKIVERVEFYLCEEYAQFMCYETGSIWVSEDELWNCLEPFGDVSSDNTLYNFTKEKAIELIGEFEWIWSCGFISSQFIRIYLYNYTIHISISRCNFERNWLSTLVQSSY
ncbi:uncharacterized protein [Arachis hypogaea]|uniref:uncharacterized protein isoform X1 n=1 Tax=Arachis hypogaea TaxID=3818 RepID=UPI003B21FF39